jgi:hypothetical protein
MRHALQLVLTFLAGCVRLVSTFVVCATAAAGFLALWVIERISDSIGERDG